MGKIKRNIRYFFARLFLRIAVVIVYFIPLSFFRRWGVLLSRLFYKFSNHYRNLAYNNLRFVFPEEKEVEKIFYRSSLLLGENIADTFWFLAYPRRRGNLINIEHKEILDWALSFKRGVIGITAHIGAFTILGGALTQQGYKVNCLLRNPRDEKMAGVLERGLRMQGVRSIFTKPSLKCIEEVLESLKNNEILIVLIDQRAGRSGVFVKFFGHYTSVPTGPVIFSLRTGAKIIPMFMIREGQKHNLKIFPEFKIIYKENIEKTIFENTQNLILLIEGVIREYPEQWSWIDRRWNLHIVNKGG